MYEQTDLTAQLAALQAQIAAMRPAAPSASPWSAPAVANVPAIIGVAVPVKIQTPVGSLRIYLSLGAECAATPETLLAALEALAASGLPLDTWSPRDSGSAGGWGASGSAGRGGYAGNPANRFWRR